MDIHVKRILFALVLAYVALPATAADVGVSVTIGQPGFYGRIDIGGYPPPVLVYPQPVVIVPAPVMGPPVYLRVPPGHAKHWAKHCHEYGACGERVYFVQDSWYNQVYAPRYQREHEGRERESGYYGREGAPYHYDRGGGRGQGRGEGHGRGHDH